MSNATMIFSGLDSLREFMAGNKPVNDLRQVNVMIWELNSILQGTVKLKELSDERRELDLQAAGTTLDQLCEKCCALHEELQPPMPGPPQPDCFPNSTTAPVEAEGVKGTNIDWRSSIRPLALAILTQCEQLFNKDDSTPTPEEPAVVQTASPTTATTPQPAPIPSEPVAPTPTSATPAPVVVTTPGRRENVPSCNPPVFPPGSGRR